MSVAGESGRFSWCKRETFITIRGDLITGTFIAIKTAHIRHENFWFARNIGAHVPRISQRIQSCISNIVVVPNPTIFGRLIRLDTN